MNLVMPPTTNVMMSGNHHRDTVSAPIVISEDDMLLQGPSSSTTSNNNRNGNKENNNKDVRSSSNNSKMRRCASMPTTLFDVQSILRYRTIDESLRSNYDTQESCGKGSIKFDKIQMREYNRTVGDNPSCSSGPPVSIGWKYNIVGDVSVDVYENTRPPRRSHFEMVLPRKVRFDMLKRDWDVKQQDIAEAVRRNVKTKNQRKATVNNLNKATTFEMAMESAGRKLKRFVMFQKPVSQQIIDLDDKFMEVEKKRKQYRLEVQMASEINLSGTQNSQDMEEEAVLDVSNRTM